jgi:Phytanoyl-CoA dioxygenase (PhyH)
LTLEELMTRRPQAEFPVSLTPAQIEQFRECGFTSIERITTDTELAWLGEIYDRLFAERINPVPGAYVDLVKPNGSSEADSQAQILLPELQFPELRKTAFWRNGRRLASALLGLELSAVRGWGHMIRKPARDTDSGALPWHQDEAYWDRSFTYMATSCWMPLDPATVESGCMSFIPGSHRSGVREHRKTGGDFVGHVVSVEGVDPMLAVPVPVDAGGAVFHHCRTLHSSGPNRSARVRRAYANEWQLEPVKR